MFSGGGFGPREANEGEWGEERRGEVGGEEGWVPEVEWDEKIDCLAEDANDLSDSLLDFLRTLNPTLSPPP